MAEVDPLSCLTLEPGERVLWQGRPRVGAPWPGRPLAALAGVSIALVALSLVCVTFLGTDPPTGLGRSFVPALPLLGAGIVVAAVLGASAVVGPFYGSITVLTLWGAAFAAHWTTLVRRRGWEGAAGALGTDDLVAIAVFLGLPSLRIAVGVVRRLGEVVVITDRRVAAIRAGARAATLLWEQPLPGGPADLRLERPWRSPGGVLVAGDRALCLRGVDPERLLADLRGPGAP